MSDENWQFLIVFGFYAVVIVAAIIGAAVVTVRIATPPQRPRESVMPKWKSTTREIRREPK